MRPQLDGALRLNAGQLKRQGWLKPGLSTSGTMEWKNTLTGERTAAIGFSATADQDEGEARLNYWTTLGDGRRVSMDYTIALVSTVQPFGGVRWWFVCPTTGARAAVLYLPAGRTRFASQRALRGSYRTQRISPRDRAMERAQDIDMALGGSGNLFDWWPHKPPRMHWSTFDRKWERASRAREASLGFLADHLDRTRPAWRRSALATSA